MNRKQELELKKGLSSLGYVEFTDEDKQELIEIYKKEKVDDIP